ncbi:hypothetical protein EDD18DRAFT_1112149 [Armillaria luteobubalina]|uniref:Uncharacterized protein n=1 Tax=Armillaria luteobubalina TaxID=153913 RepID=A0AA39PH22_9AGAR|nr:hypothetical protein EDD18DRAFT_1112149 [Armillaria luteobubalina]
MPSQPSPSIPSIGETFGVLYIGATIAAILFGITNLQMVIYYKKYPNDMSFYRYSVALLWVLDALHVAFTTHALYLYLIDMFGDLSGAMLHSVWYVSGWRHKVQLGMNVATVVYVQGCQNSCDIWFVIPQPQISRKFPTSKYGIAHPAIVWIVLDAYLNIIDIQSCCLFHGVSNRHPGNPHDVLLSAQEQSSHEFLHYGFPPSKSDVPHYCVRVFRAQEFNLAANSFIVWPDTLIFLGIVFVLPKLYVNSLLAMFNYQRQDESHKLNTTSSIPYEGIQDIHAFKNTPDHSK